MILRPLLTWDVLFILNAISCMFILLHYVHSTFTSEYQFVEPLGIFCNMCSLKNLFFKLFQDLIILICMSFYISFKKTIKSYMQTQMCHQFNCPGCTCQDSTYSCWVTTGVVWMVREPSLVRPSSQHSMKTLYVMMCYVLEFEVLLTIHFEIEALLPLYFCID